MQGDLASRTLVLESKRFYLDVKENQRGRFVILRKKKVVFKHHSQVHQNC